MNVATAAILGIVQGLTEFLPVSSSGHLVIFQKLIPGFSQPGVLFDVILHLGTTLAVLYFFRKRIFSLEPKYLGYITVGTIPVVVFGLLFRKPLESLFLNDNFLGVEFIFTGILNFLVDQKPAKKGVLNIKNSFIIGISQAISIIPAISRSGITIFTGIKLGIARKKVAEYSFLLSIPAILGANLLELMFHGTRSPEFLPVTYAAGFLAAFLVGFASIGILLKLLDERRFKFFGYYTIVLGLLVMLF